MLEKKRESRYVTATRDENVLLLYFTIINGRDLDSKGNSHVFLTKNF
jgi:hypothetical protein